MASQTRNPSIPLGTNNQSSGGIIAQLMRLLSQPVAFFRALPSNHHWVIALMLVLIVTGYTATTEEQSASESLSAGGGTETTGFDLSLLDETATPTNMTSQTDTDSSTTTSDEALMNALLAASGVLITWSGQAALLSLVTMLRGYPPQFKKSFQIAVWASLPLALMLILRQIHYSMGGAGGALGLSLLLENWDVYRTLNEYIQRFLAVFMSNFTLFWLWSILLLYFGARYALKGQRVAVVFVIGLWILISTLVPALISEPETETAPRNVVTTTTGTQNDENAGNANNTAETEMQAFPGGEGGFGGGESGPPDGGGFGGPPGN